MKPQKGTIIFVLAAVFLSSVASILKANYYLDTLFPIGLTGLNGAATGNGNCPYGGLPVPWSWDAGDRQEKQLIFNLGINCIGAQDAKPDYLTKVYKRTIDKNITLNIIFTNN